MNSSGGDHGYAEIADGIRGHMARALSVDRPDEQLLVGLSAALVNVEQAALLARSEQHGGPPLQSPLGEWGGFDPR